MFTINIILYLRMILSLKRENCPKKEQLQIEMHWITLPYSQRNQTKR
jgi:hypothetical protein